jgi:hypothetical protein
MAFICGLLPQLIAVPWFIYMRHFLAYATRADGTVTQLVDRPTNNGDRYYPAVQFIDSGGKAHTINSHFGSNPAAYKVGDHVVVAYHPTTPDDGMICSFWPNWGISVLFGGSGLFWIIIGVYCIFSSRLRALDPPTVPNRISAT